MSTSVCKMAFEFFHFVHSFRGYHRSIRESSNSPFASTCFYIAFAINDRTYRERCLVGILDARRPRNLPFFFTILLSQKNGRTLGVHNQDIDSAETRAQKKNTGRGRDASWHKEELDGLCRAQSGHKTGNHGANRYEKGRSVQWRGVGVPPSTLDNPLLPARSGRGSLALPERLQSSLHRETALIVHCLTSERQILASIPRHPARRRATSLSFNSRVPCIVLHSVQFRLRYSSSDCLSSQAGFSRRESRFERLEEFFIWRFGLWSSAIVARPADIQLKIWWNRIKCVLI